jgi:hypothetical protein
LIFSIYDRDILGGDDVCGTAELFPWAELEGGHSHEFVVELSPQGKVRLEMQMHGEERSDPEVGLQIAVVSPSHCQDLV